MPASTNELVFAPLGGVGEIGMNLSLYGLGPERARKWLSNLVEMQEGGNSEEFIESVKVDLFPDKVYVFTPRGEILR